MNPKYTHDFSSASIKHQIEAEFYSKVGEALSQTQRTATIVTGPDYQRHIDNFRRCVGKDKLRICEIDTDIFISIYQGCKDVKDISVVNKSIDLYGSTFIDCDLTCVSDLDVIRKTLLRQIDTQAQIVTKNKAFIFSFSLRSGTGVCKTMTAYLRPILGLLGASITKDLVITPTSTIDSHNWAKDIKIYGARGRIKDYKCYCYNAGGGPMLTCLIIYK